ncbi:MAG: hypothetical protein D6795_04060 [Deltaproteobacteria bacterium]|nr:MAG: hypothetical protein D6795_04060 [Deltaproteobacteria bacterium]
MKRFVNLAMTVLTAATLWGLQGCPVFPINMAVEDTAELSITVLDCTEETRPDIVLLDPTLTWDENATSFGKEAGADACTFHVYFTPTLPNLYRLRVSTTHLDGNEEEAAEELAQVSRPPVLGASTILQIVIEGGPDEDRIVQTIEIASEIAGIQP